MFNIGCHNVTDVHTVRIQHGLSEGEGYLTLCFHATNFHTDEEEVSNEYTLFFKDIEKGYDSLLAALQKGMRAYDAEDSKRFQEKLAKEQSNDG